MEKKRSRRLLVRTKEKKNKYLKLLDKINHLADEISKEAGTFKSESGKR